MKCQEGNVKKKNNPFKIRSKKILKNKPNKGGENLYAENYKTLIKEVKDALKKWKAIPCSWIGRIILLK